MQHNLIDPIPEVVRRSQVVFCRNVLIYFSPDHARKFADRVVDTLPAAAVFLGSAEAMWPISPRYETVHAADTFYYRARTGQASPTPTPAGRAPAPPLRPVPVPVPVRAAPPTAPRVRPAPPSTPDSESNDAAAIARTGHQFLDAGDFARAVVAFRKCAYLAPDDALSHVHLGLALEASGDGRAARRAFETARRALLDKDPTHVEHAIGGYATSELLRLLDTKRQVRTP